MEPYRVLEWDSAFFGFTVVQIQLAEPDARQLECTLEELRRRRVRLAYWSSSFDGCVPRSHAAALGGRLVDEKMTFLVDLECALTALKVDAHDGVVVVPYNATMSNADLRALAIQSGKFSRFAVDPNIPKTKFEELYTIWIDKSLSNEIADEVLVIRGTDGRVVGMTTLGSKGGRGDIGLLAVDRKFRGRRFGEMLVRSAQQWFIAHGYKYGQVVTQGANKAACRLYTKCGFSLEKTALYYHFWL